MNICFGRKVSSFGEWTWTGTFMKCMRDWVADSMLINHEGARQSREDNRQSMTNAAWKFTRSTLETIRTAQKLTGPHRRESQTRLSHMSHVSRHSLSEPHGRFHPHPISTPSPLSLHPSSPSQCHNHCLPAKSSSHPSSPFPRHARPRLARYATSHTHQNTSRLSYPHAATFSASSAY